jgi:hypothetical protein
MHVFICLVTTFPSEQRVIQFYKIVISPVTRHLGRGAFRVQPVQGALGVRPPGLLLGSAKVLVLPECGPAEHGVPGAAAEDEADGELDNVQREVGHNGP